MTDHHDHDNARWFPHLGMFFYFIYISISAHTCVWIIYAMCHSKHENMTISAVFSCLDFPDILPLLPLPRHKKHGQCAVFSVSGFLYHSKHKKHSQNSCVFCALTVLSSLLHLPPTQTQKMQLIQPCFLCLGSSIVSPLPSPSPYPDTKCGCVGRVFVSGVFFRLSPPFHPLPVRGTPYAPDACPSSASVSDSRLPSAPAPATSSLFRNAFGRMTSYATHSRPTSAPDRVMSCDVA